MPQETLEETAEKLAQVLGVVSPAQATAAIQRTLALRPRNWSGKSAAPYYDKQHGEMAMKILDKLAATPGMESKGLFLGSKVFGCVAGTVYNKWNQGALFLIENLDTPEGKYQEIHSRLDVTRRSDGILLSLRKPFNIDAVEILEVSKEKTGVVVNNTWRLELEQWLDNPEGAEVFTKEGLHLSYEEVEELKSSFVGIDSLAFKVTGNKIVLRKV